MIGTTEQREAFTRQAADVPYVKGIPYRMLILRAIFNGRFVRRNAMNVGRYHAK